MKPSQKPFCRKTDIFKHHNIINGILTLFMIEPSIDIFSVWNFHNCCFSPTLTHCFGGNGIHLSSDDVFISTKDQFGHRSHIDLFRDKKRFVEDVCFNRHFILLIVLAYTFTCFRYTLGYVFLFADVNFQISQ